MLGVFKYFDKKIANLYNFTDDELSKELRSTLEELNVLIKDIKENPNRYFKFSIF